MNSPISLRSTANFSYALALLSSRKCRLCLALFSHGNQVPILLVHENHLTEVLKRWDCLATQGFWPFPGGIIWPHKDSENYLSLVGLIDTRSTLYVDASAAGKANSTQADTHTFPDENVGSRYTADVCVMAAKFCYESKATAKKLVNEGMKMHFVDFYNCWNGKSLYYTSPAALWIHSLQIYSRRFQTSEPHPNLHK